MSHDSAALDETPPIVRESVTDLSAGRGKLFGILIAASVLASVVIIPYSADMLGQAPGAAAMATSWLLISQIVLNLVISVPAVAAGLLLGPRLGLGAPLLSAWLAGQADALRPARSRLGGAAAVGVGLGLLVFAASMIVGRMFPEAYTSFSAPTPWNGLLAAISAGINEEILLRLGLMTTLAWFTTKLQRGSRAIWLANILAALGFAALHLPVAITFMPVTALVLAWVLVANGSLGLVFGWLYWRRGLEAAMAAHFAADVVLHAVAPAVGLG